MWSALIKRLMGALLVGLIVVAQPVVAVEEKREQVQVTSDPSGARISMRSGQSCFTPCFLNLSRKRESLLIVSKRGFRTSEVNFRPTRKQKKLHVSLIAQPDMELSLSFSNHSKGVVWSSNAFIEDFKLPQGKANADDVAVIVGNFHYRHADLPNVAPARNDARIMRRYVIETLGIPTENVIYKENATYADLIALFGDDDSSKSKLTSRIKLGKGRIFVYYSGHGASGGSSSFLVPVDADPSFIESVGYPIEWLYRNLSQIEIAERTAIVESCFSGNSHGGTLIKNASPIAIRSSVKPVPDNVNALMASSKDQIASWDQSTGLSLFTKYFLLGQAGLADQSPVGNEDGVISELEMMTYVEEEVRVQAQTLYDREQSPQFHFASDR